MCCSAFILARYFRASSEIGMVVFIPAESACKSGLDFLSSASARGLRCAFPEHTNSTFMLFHVVSCFSFYS